MKYFYRDVPGLGSVAVSRHAQDRMTADNISQESFDKALLHPPGTDTPDGMDIIWRERDNVRIVILLRPEPYAGAALVKTVYRVEAQATVRK